MSEQAKTGTRISHQPDWLVDGLLRVAAFADQEPDQPMFNTGVSLSQLKDQIRALLGRSEVGLTSREIGSGTHWLASRIANDIDETDTKESLTESMLHFAAQYILDKSHQRQTGISERSPIYDRAWYEKNYGNPPPDKGAAASGVARTAEEKKKDEESASGETPGMIYLGLDGDDMGHLVEDSLLTDDPEIAANISNSIHDAHRAIRKLVSGIGGRLIFDGGDNMLFYMPNVPEVFDAIEAAHKRYTKHSVTIGVGRRPIEAHYALVVGKNTGKDKIVIYDEDVKAKHQTIHEEQALLESDQKKLKYRASSEEANAAKLIEKALMARGVDASPSAVNEMFWRLVQKHNLSNMSAIEKFFATHGVDANSLVAATAGTFAKRANWALLHSEARELTKVDGQAIVHDLIIAAEAVGAIAPKFRDVMNAVDSQELRDLDEGMGFACSQAETKMAEFAKVITEDGTLRYSHYADELGKLSAEIASMAIPIDQEITVALKAVVNAESVGNSSVNLNPLTQVIGRWIERVSTLAMVLDMVLVVSGARPMEKKKEAASAPVNFPGQTNLPKSKNETPYAPHDWLTIEDRNKQVDWRKTDDQAGMTLPGDMAERSVGGDAGGSPIYVA